MKLRLSVNVPDHIDRKQRVFGVLLVIVCLGAAAGVWWLTTAGNVRHASTNLSRDVSEVVEVFERRLEVYADVLYGGRGLALVNPEFTRRDWDTYMQSQNIFQRYPGVSSVAYLQSVRASEAGAFEESINSMRIPGEPTVRISPLPLRETMAPITYVTPYQFQDRVGQDVIQQESHAEAFAQAAVSGVPVASKSFQSTSSLDDTTTRVSVILAVYGDAYRDTMTDGEKQAAVTGYIVVTIKPELIFEEAMNLLQTEEDIFVSVNDESDAPLYTSGTMPMTLDRMQESVTVMVGGKTWNIEVTSEAGYGLLIRERWAPLILLLGGVFFTGMLVTFYFYRSGVRVSTAWTGHPSKK